jgi:hypothetical protein
VRRRGRERLKSSDPSLKEGEESRLVTSSATEVGGRRREEAGEGEFEVFRFRFEGGLGVPPRDLVGYGSGVGDDVRRRGKESLKFSDSSLKEAPRDLVGYGSGWPTT